MLFSVTVSAFAAGSEQAVSEQAGSKEPYSEMTADEVFREDEVLRELDNPNTAGSKKTADEVARQLDNPNTPLASLTFRNQYRRPSRRMVPSTRRIATYLTPCSI